MTDAKSATRHDTEILVDYSSTFEGADDHFALGRLVTEGDEQLDELLARS